VCSYSDCVGGVEWDVNIAEFMITFKSKMKNKLKKEVKSDINNEV
jgi:hypothetical protein